MAGLILLATLIALVAALIWLSGLISRRLPVSDGWKTLLRMLIVVGAFPLLVADEIIGRHQFESLCNLHSNFEMGVSNPIGRIARLEVMPERERMPTSAIPIFRTRMSYFDIQTGELVVALERFEAKGGWLIRGLGASEGDHPIIIKQATCSPESKRHEWVAVTFKFKVVN